MRSIWLFFSLESFSCGCPCNRSPIAWGCMRAPEFGSRGLFGVCLAAYGDLVSRPSNRPSGAGGYQRAVTKSIDHPIR